MMLHHALAGALLLCSLQQKPAIPKVDDARKYRVKKQREGPDHGDDSNSLYAAVGRRACHDSGIILPKEVVEKAAWAWRDSQTATKGWSYGPKGNTAYGSMTAGGVAAL